jgi:hypothetical protein
MLHKATVKSLDGVLTILRQRASRRGADKPCVDIDANWVARKFASHTGGPASPMIGLAKLLLVGGCDVHIYGDGEE